MKGIQIKGALKRIIIFFSVLLLFSSSRVKAQDEIQEPMQLRYQSVMVGIGNAKVYDTYLSPLVYKGMDFGLIYENMKNTGLMRGRISIQHLLNLDIAVTDNLTKTATNYFGSLEYGFGMYYRSSPVNNLLLFGGLQADGLIGGIYNTRNGNNPASGKAHLNLNLSGMAAYHFSICRQSFIARYQVNSPFIGAFFAPQYGQSYYEIGLGVDAPIVHFASFHNYRAMRNLLSLEIPFNRCTLRLSYANWIYETNINDLDTQIISNSFYVGFSRNIFSVSSKKKRSNHLKTVFDIE